MEKEPKPGLVVGRPGEDQCEGRLSMKLHGRGQAWVTEGVLGAAIRGPRRPMKGGVLAGGPQDVSR